MTIQEIEHIHRLASQCIHNAEINDAFSKISALVNELGRGNLNDELEQLRMSYTFMLNYLEQERPSMSHLTKLKFTLMAVR